MPLRIEEVTQENSRALANLLQLYLHEKSAFNAESIDDEALFTYSDWDNCMSGEELKAYYILVKNRIAGFIVVRNREGEPREVNDFFLLNTYRGLGLGRDCALLTFSTWPGRWRVMSTESSSAARSFWRKVVREASHKHYSVGHDRAKGLVYYEFVFVPSSSMGMKSTLSTSGD